MSPERANRSANPTSARRADRLDALIVFVLSGTYLALLPNCFNVFDEGLVAAIAERLARGEILYRDLFSYWHPGAFWLHAALFRSFGVDVEAFRTPMVLGGALMAVGVWRLARDHAGRGPAVVAGLGSAVVCLPVWWMVSPHWYALFAAVAGFVALRAGIDGDGRLAWAASGAACGVGFVFLQPVGVFLAAGVAAAVIWDGAWRGPLADTLRRIAWLTLGGLVPALAMYGYFALHGALGAMIEDTFLWSFRHYGETLRAGYGSAVGMPDHVALRATRWLLMTAPPLVTLWALGSAGLAYLRRAEGLVDRRLFALAVAESALLASSYYYPDVVHLAFGAPPAFALIAALLARIGAQPLGRPVARGGLFLTFVFVAVVGLGFLRSQRAECSAELATPRGSIALRPDAEADLRALLSFLDRRLEPGESLFAYPFAPGLHFLSGHPNPTPYEAVAPHRASYASAEELARVVAALESAPVRYVLVSPPFGRAYLERHDTVLERYLRDAYHVAEELPLTVVLERDAPGRSGPKLRARAGREPIR